MLVKVTMWQTDDGAYHTSKDAAHAHDQREALKKYVNEHPISPRVGDTDVDGIDLVSWMELHSRIFLTLLPDDKAVDN